MLGFLLVRIEESIDQPAAALAAAEQNVPENEDRHQPERPHGPREPLHPTILLGPGINGPHTGPVYEVPFGARGIQGPEWTDVPG